MLSLSRCPSKKRKQKKPSSSSSSLLLTVATKSSIASVNRLDDQDGNGDDYDDDDDIVLSISPPQSTSKIDPDSKTIDIEKSKENQEQQVQMLKRRRERKRKRQIKMESALESILKPAVQQSDSSELRRMETRFWNDDDSDDYDIENQSSDPPVTEPSCDSSAKSQHTTSMRTAKALVTRSRPLISTLSLGGDANGSESDKDPLFGKPPMTFKNGEKRTQSKPVQQARLSIPSFPLTDNVGLNEAGSHEGIHATRIPPSTTSSNTGNKKNDLAHVTISNKARTRPEDTKLPQARNMINLEAPSPGAGDGSHNIVWNTSAGQQSACTEPKDGVLLSNTNGNEKTSSVLSTPSTDDVQLSFNDAPDSGDIEIDMQNVQCGHNSTVAKSGNDPYISGADDNNLVHENDASKGKTAASNQFSHSLKIDSVDLGNRSGSPSRAHMPESVTTTVPLSNRDVQPKVALPSLPVCAIVNMQLNSILETENDIEPNKDQSKTDPPQLKSMDKLGLETRERETSASDSEPGTSSNTMHDEQTEPIIDKKSATKCGPNQKPKSKARKCRVSHTPSTSKSAKAAPKGGNVALAGAEGASPKKNRRKRILKTSKLPATECNEIDSDCDQIAPKASQRGKKRVRKGSCALCTTCPCKKARNDETTGTVDLQSFARSDCAMEKALIRRLKKIEKSCENLQDQQETIKRKLKRHRRDILRKKTKVSSEDKVLSYFLPDADALEASECQPSKVTDDWVAYAQKRMFPSILDDNQPSLTQLGFCLSKSKKSIDESEPSDTNTETQPAPTAEPHGEPVELPVAAFEINKSRCSTNECGKIKDDEDSKDSFLEFATKRDDESYEGSSGFEKANRITWRNGSKRTNDLVASSALEGLVVRSEEVQQFEDANSVLSLTQEERPMGRTEPCQWDSLFSDCVMGGEIHEIDRLAKLIDSRSLCGTQESSGRSSGVAGISVASCFDDDSTQGGKEAAEFLITKISSDVRNVDALGRVCPNWKENVSFAFRQKKSDVQNALQSLQESRARLDHTKEMILDAWNRNKTTMDVFRDALEQSLDRFKS